jgi:hypothetical protein
MTTYLKVCDLNGNGYPEVIEAWVENSSAVVLWEIEGVRLHQPNGWEVLNPGQPYNLTWEKFDPPGADSFALFFSPDNGRSYDTIAVGLSAADTSYLWTVANEISDSCKIMIWAYGPPRPGQQTPRGTAWDFSDTLFSIQSVGITENQRVPNLKTDIVIIPNPSSGTIFLQLSIPSIMPVSVIVYDITGRIVEILVEEKYNPGVHKIGLNNDFSSGIYYIQLRTPHAVITKKMIILKK